MHKAQETSHGVSPQAVAMLLIVMVSSLLLCAKFVPVSAESDVIIDLFTQKAPFDGKGINQSSDMFGPQEIVKLYTMVLAHGAPAVESLVTFEISGPASPPNEIRFFRTAVTNASGFAETEFSLAVVNQTASFGTWAAVASVEKAGRVYKDFLGFQVYWQVESISVRTVDENPPNSTGSPPDRLSFGIGGYVGIEIVLRNNAMSQKTPNITMSIFDELARPINSSSIGDFVLCPSGRLVYLYRTILFPKYGVPGNATVFVEVLDSNGVAYSPEVSCHFRITIFDPVFPKFVDVSVCCIDVSPRIVQPDGNSSVTIMLRNEGTVPTSNARVRVSVNGSLLVEKLFLSMAPYESEIFTATWTTNGFSEGNYTIFADVPILPMEADLSDNNCTDFVEINALKKHDVAITMVTASPSVGYIGDDVSIVVETVNLGNSTEAFNVTVYYNASAIASAKVSLINPGQKITLNFAWNTSNVAEGSYIILASAEPVPGEVNIENNVFTDGEVTLLSKPSHYVRDIAVTWLLANPIEVQVGQNITITAIVANLGNMSESFNLTLLYDSYVIQVIPVISLPTHSQETILHEWNTTDVASGTYKLRASATILEGEVNTENNSFDDGYITIQTAEAISARHVLVYLMLFMVVLAVIASLVLFLLLYHLKRRKKPPRRYYTVIVHPRS